MSIAYITYGYKELRQMSLKVHIFGSGGQALNCVDSFMLRREFAPVVVGSVPHPDKDWPCDYIPEENLNWADVTHAFVAIGDNFKRQAVVAKVTAKVPNVVFPACVHPSVSMGFQSRVGDGTYIGAGSKIGPLCNIGVHALINMGVTIEHESSVGEFTNIGTGSSLAGGVTLGARALVGVGASVIHGIRISSDALIGSGACVVKDVEANSVMIGIPAKTARTRRFGEPFL